MSCLGAFLIVCLFILRLIPEAMTLLLASGTGRSKGGRHVKTYSFFLLLLLTGGVNFLVYFLLHRRLLLTWDMFDTIVRIARLDFVYQNVPYFIKSILICTIFALAFGMVLRRMLQKAGRRTLGMYRKSALFLLTGTAVLAAVICYGIRCFGDKKLLINEVCSKNKTVVLKPYGEACDYVELYNDGWLPHFIWGLYLSDDAGDLKKYAVPLHILYPQEYQVVALNDDAPFHVSEEGEVLYLSDEDGKILDQVECIALKGDQAYSRIEDGSEVFEIRTCTPGKSNLKSDPVLLPPAFSHKSGFYSEAFELVLSAGEGTQIFYTLDGSAPTRESGLYTEPILIGDASLKENVWSMRKDVSAGFLPENVEESGYRTPAYPVDKCTVIRAISVDEEGNESLIASGTYFVDYQHKEGYQGMNVVSLMTDPESLFGYDKGIYVTGKVYEDTKAAIPDQWFADYWFWWEANYTQAGEEWEREACLQFFDNKGELILTKNAGIRIQGGANRGKLPKSLNLYARDTYDGSSRFEADFFGSSYQPQRMTLFAGGDDSQINLRDCLAANACGKRHFATMDFAPYVLFLNGEYWGCYWLTEKYDKEYFEYHYHIDGDDLLLMKNGRYGFGAIEKEDMELYEEMRSAVIDADLSVEENYQRVCEILDIDSFLDYYAAEIYIGRSGDWPSGNFALWRTRETGEGTYSDGRWRFLLFDVNGYSMESWLTEEDTYQNVIRQDPLFASLMENPKCREQFAATILDMAENEFLPERINAFLADFEVLMEAPLRKEHQRFYGDSEQNRLDFEGEIQEVRAFFEGRYEYITNYFQSEGGSADE